MKDGMQKILYLSFETFNMRYIDEDFEVIDKEIYGLRCIPLEVGKGCPIEYGCRLWEKYEDVLKAMDNVPIADFIDLVPEKGERNHITEMTSSPCGELEIRFDTPQNIFVKNGTLTVKSQDLHFSIYEK